MACTTSVLPAVEFDDCAPSIHFGQIGKIYLTRNTSADVLADVTDDTEWTTRIDNDAVIPGSGAAPIRQLTVIGSMPKPTTTETKISGGRKVSSAAENVINFAVDETNIANIAMARTIQTAGTITYKCWFEADGLMSGGDSGFAATISIFYVIPESDTDVQKLEGTLTWTGVQPEVTLSPF
jgi:hypothetical protein